MALMTEARYNKLSKELVAVKAKLEVALVEQAAAQELGDLRENTEYETARMVSESLVKKKAELEDELANAQIVENDNSPRITVGSTVDVCRVDAKGSPVEDARRFVVEAKGDTVIQGILGVNSPLGKVILNGTNGIYRVVENGGVQYQVKKVQNG